MSVESEFQEFRVPKTSKLATDDRICTYVPGVSVVLVLSTPFTLVNVHEQSGPG